MAEQPVDIEPTGQNVPVGRPQRSRKQSVAEARFPSLTKCD